MTLVVISMFAFAGTHSFNKAMKENLNLLRSHQDQTNYLELGINFNGLLTKTKTGLNPCIMPLIVIFSAAGRWKTPPKRRTSLIRQMLK